MRALICLAIWFLIGAIAVASAQSSPERIENPKVKGENIDHCADIDGVNDCSALGQSKAAIKVCIAYGYAITWIYIGMHRQVWPHITFHNTTCTLERWRVAGNRGPAMACLTGLSAGNRRGLRSTKLATTRRCRRRRGTIPATFLRWHCSR